MLFIFREGRGVSTVLSLRCAWHFWALGVPPALTVADHGIAGDVVGNAARLHAAVGECGAPVGISRDRDGDRVKGGNKAACRGVGRVHEGPLGGASAHDMARIVVVERPAEQRPGQKNIISSIVCSRLLSAFVRLLLYALDSYTGVHWVLPVLGRAGAWCVAANVHRVLEAMLGHKAVHMSELGGWLTGLG